MKFFKNKYFAISLTSFVIFVISAFFILSASIPDNLFVTSDDTNGRWIPRGWQWIVSSEGSGSEPAMENTSGRRINEQRDSLSETVYLCGVIPVKTVNLSITDEMKVVPGGECIGIDLKTRGILAVGLEPFEGESGKRICPAKDSGIKAGDIIERINGVSVKRISQVQKIIESFSGGSLLFEGTRNGKEISWNVTPEPAKNSDKKLIGVWLRESVAGIGTLTFYHDGTFGALGHAIADADTGDEVSEKGGTICSAGIIGISKGEKGEPGALKGIFTGVEKGKIISNSPVGIYGTTPCAPNDSAPVELASRKDIHPGKAHIICDIGNGKSNFGIEILKVFPSSTDTKSMIIQITDKNLIEKTGGIVQGMSGSPIIQNGKLIGAVTHVFVNDPTRGYGIFIENMLAEAEKIK